MVKKGSFSYQTPYKWLFSYKTPYKRSFLTENLINISNRWESRLWALKWSLFEYKSLGIAPLSSKSWGIAPLRVKFCRKPLCSEPFLLNPYHLRTNGYLWISVFRSIFDPFFDVFWVSESQYLSLEKLQPLY